MTVAELIAELQRMELMGMNGEVLVRDWPRGEYVLATPTGSVVGEVYILPAAS